MKADLLGQHFDVSVMDLPGQSEKLQIHHCSSSISTYPERSILVTAGQKSCFISHGKEGGKEKDVGHNDSGDSCITWLGQDGAIPWNC